MEQNYPEEFKRLTKYVDRKATKLFRLLGYGVDGLVYSTNKGSAVKAHRGKSLFEKELRIYQRLDQHPNNDFAGFNVQKLLDFHPELWVIEMQFVVTPFALDFVGATLDQPSAAIAEQTEEEYAEWEESKIEIFGAEDWQVVQTVISCFRRIGIHLSDVHKGNIKLREESME